MKRSSPSKSVSGVTQSKSEKQSVPTVVEVGQSPVVTEQPVKAPSKRGKKVKEVVVDTIPTPATPLVPSTPSVSLEKSSKHVVETTSVGGEQLEAELANTPADEFDVRCTEFFNSLRDLVNKSTDLKNEFKAIERLWAKRLKTVSKSGKKKKTSGTRAPSGFVKPTLISNELALFLGKEPGTEMARTEVTREINVYIRSNKLQDTENGRIINADPALASLLRLSPSDKLTYFNLQKYMSSHFPKAVDAVDTA